jgi:predicted aspartyl protease
VTASFDPRRRAIIVPVDLLGPLGAITLSLLLDTGSAYTVVSPRSLEDAGYDLAKPRSAVTIATPSRVGRIPLYIVSSVTALGHISRNVAVLAHALPPAIRVDRLLGMNFLGDRRLTIDFGSGTVNPE